MAFKEFLKKNWSRILASIGWFYYLLITIFFFNYISILMLIGITIAMPTLILSLRSRNKDKKKPILTRRLIITGIVLGILTFAAFPNILRIPSQVYRRINRTEITITPEDPVVKAFREELFDKYGGAEAFRNTTLRLQLDRLDLFTQEKIIWTEDILTVHLAGDISTPKESIERGRDDCRGQACVMASVLIGMDIDAWVVEMAWHWWVMVYDDNGKEYKLNHDGHSNDTIQYPITMMWNDEEIKIIGTPWEIYNALMISSPALYRYLFYFNFVPFIVVSLMGVGLTIYSSICLGDLPAIRRKEKGFLKRLRLRFLYGTLLSSILIGILVILYFTPLSRFIGFYLLVYGFTGIVTFMNLEEINKKFIKKE